MVLRHLIEETAFVGVRVAVPRVPCKVVRGREGAGEQLHAPCGTEAVQWRRSEGFAPASDAYGMGSRPWSRA